MPQQLQVPRLAPVDLRWGRGCGSGIGFSGHKNRYPPGTLVNNFVEDRTALEHVATGHHHLGFQQPGTFETTHRVGYTRTASEYKACLDKCRITRKADMLREVRAL
jgi:hypothetical protein